MVPHTSYYHIIFRAGRGSASAILMALVLSLTIPWQISAEESPDKINEAIREYFSVLQQNGDADLDRRIREIRQKAALFDREGFNKGAFMARLTAGRLLMQKPDHERALRELEEASEIAGRTHDLQGQGFTLLKIAELEADRANLDKSQELLKKALSSVGPVGDRTLLARIRTMMAGIHAYRGHLKQAADRLDKALPQLKEAQDHEYLAKNRQFRARVYAIRNLFEKSNRCFALALEHSRKGNHSKLSNIILVNRAKLYLDMEAPDKAMPLLREAIKWFENDTDDRLGAWARTVTARVLIMESKVDKARKLLEESSRGLAGSEALLFRLEHHLCSCLAQRDLGDLKAADREAGEAQQIADRLKLSAQALETWIEHGNISAQTGRFSFGIAKVDKAIERASKFKAHKTLARAWLAKAMILKSAGAYSMACVASEKALGIGIFDDRQSRVHRLSLLNRGQCLVHLGYPNQSYLDAKELIAGTGPDNESVLHFKAQLLQARATAMSGGYERAHELLIQARAGIEKLDDPLLTAHLKAAFGEITELQGALEEAYSHWESAQSSFRSCYSLENAMKCRARQVRICLDIKAPRRARAAAESGYSVFWADSSPSPLAGDRVVSPEIGHYPEIFKIQYSSGFGPQGPGAKQHWDSLDEVNIETSTYRSDPRSGADRDTDRIIAGHKLMKGEIHLLEDDFERTQETCSEALEILGQSKPLSGHLHNALSRTLALARVGLDKYIEAKEGFKYADYNDRWIKDFLAALSPMEDDNPVQAAKKLENVLLDLLKRERSKGLWTVNHNRRRLRETVFEKLVLAHMESAGVKKDSAPFEKAWTAAQRLKMRRTLYRVFGSTANGVPGMSHSMAKELRRLQYASINSELREAAGDLGHVYSQEETPFGNDGNASRFSSLDRLYVALNKKRARLFDLLECRAPTREDILKSLAQSESYISFLLTEKGIVGFRLSDQGISAGLAKGSIRDLKKKTRSLTRQVSNRYRLNVRREFSELYQDLMSVIGFKFGPGQDLVIEVDGFLWALPFEALMPGAYPKSYKERQAAQLLIDRSFITRTTSAFRFVNNARTQRSERSGNTCAIFAGPNLDPVVSGKRKNQLTGFWERPAKEFLSSSTNRVWSEKEALSAALGKNGKAYMGKSASRGRFLSDPARGATVVHLAIPALLPETPAGRLRKPMLLFTPESGDPMSGFCDAGSLLGPKRKNCLITLTWLNDHSEDISEGFILLVELLGISGSGQVMAPLWSANTTIEKDFVPYLGDVYKEIQGGLSPGEALKTVMRKEEESNGKKGNRLLKVRYALF